MVLALGFQDTHNNTNNHHRMHTNQTERKRTIKTISYCCKRWFLTFSNFTERRFCGSPRYHIRVSQ